MKRKLPWAFWIGGTIIALMALCPPWMESYRYGVTRSIGYAPIFAPPRSTTASIDPIRLLLQWISVALVIGARMVTTKESESNGKAYRGRGTPWSGIRLGVLCLFLFASAATAIIAQERWDDAVAAVALVLFLRFGILSVLQLRAGSMSGSMDRDRLRSVG